MSKQTTKKQKQEASVAGALVGLGNPLLDIAVDVEQSLLDKYGVKMNDAILAEEKHFPLYQEIQTGAQYKPKYIAGGATQNTIRVAQWMLQKPKATSFVGSVGKDENGKQLRKCAEADGVAVYYHEDAAPTGVCACLIKDKERSLVTNLQAANNYKLSHYKSKNVQDVINSAKFFYISGFFLTVSPETIMEVAKHANEHGKVFAMNLSAPFICQFFKDPQLKALPYCDYVFGNESEAEAFAKANELKDATPEGVAKYLAAMDKVGSSRARVAVITQGAGETIVCVGGKITKHKVPPLRKSRIVDSNGAGDAFVGGFLAKLIEDEPLEECVKAGNYCARTILKVSGTVLSGKPLSPDRWASC